MSGGADARSALSDVPKGETNYTYSIKFSSYFPSTKVCLGCFSGSGVRIIRDLILPNLSRTFSAFQLKTPEITIKFLGAVATPGPQDLPLSGVHDEQQISSE